MNTQQSPIPEPNMEEVKKISMEIVTSMLKRSFPAVNAMHFFKKYTIAGKPDPNFFHALTMMKDNILRIEIDEKIASNTTFVLLENGKPKMHHMIDDDYNSETFGVMINDPYEGTLKRKTCYKHLENGFTEGCNKCILERETQICMRHNICLSRCNKCKHESELIKKVVDRKNKDEFVTSQIKAYKEKYWNDLK